MERGGHADKIDDYFVSSEYEYLVEAFWQLKSLAGGLDSTITPSLLRDYCVDQAILLDRNERAIIYGMDAEFRGAISEKRREHERYMSQRARK